MKKRCWILLTSLVTVGFLGAGCSDEYMDMSTSFQSDLCVVQQPVKGAPLSLLSDPGALLLPSAVLDTDYYKAGERYLVTYIPMDSTSSSPNKSMAYSGRSVRVVDMQPVLVKPILERTDTLNVEGPDPVKVTTTPWLGGGFLNLEFLLRFDNETIKHGVWLVADSIVSRPNATVAYLSFLHNANGDASNLVATSLVSFTLASFPELERADSLVVTALEWSTGGNIRKAYAFPNRVRK